MSKQSGAFVLDFNRKVVNGKKIAGQSYINFISYDRRQSKVPLLTNSPAKRFNKFEGSSSEFNRFSKSLSPLQRNTF